MVKNFLLISSLNPPFFSFKLLPLVLLQQALQRERYWNCLNYDHLRTCPCHAVEEHCTQDPGLLRAVGLPHRRDTSSSPGNSIAG